MIINLITYSMGLAIMMLMLERDESALEVVNLWSRDNRTDNCEGCPLSLTPDVSSPGHAHGVAHSSRNVSLQPYTVTDANALSGSEDSRTLPIWHCLC